MDNIVSYMQAEQQTFAEKPFGPVDSLIASTLAYFNYESTTLVDPASSQRVRLHDIVALSDWDALCLGNWLQDAKDACPFLQALMASRRYRDVEVAFYVNECSDAVEKQFSAVTLFLGDGSAYLSFRGTDGSFAGWKEDFNLCYKEVIPSQSAAAAYLSGVASACMGPLRVGGHSKGGNLAEYAALTVDDSVYTRLVGVYDHDGPSFLGDPSPRIDSPQFQTLLNKTVPESSAFGMILECRDCYHVVKSSALSVFQHEPFSWLVEGDDFMYQDELNRSARLFDDTLDTWLRARTPAERERFIEAFYELFASTEANNWGEFHDKLLANLGRMIGSTSKLDPETRTFVMQTIGLLGSVFKEETLKAFRPSPPTWLPRRRERYTATDGATGPGQSEKKTKSQKKLAGKGKGIA